MKKPDVLPEFSPLAQQVWGRIIGRLRELSPQDPLPTELELAEQYDVSRTTVRRVLEYLEMTGLIFRNDSQRVLGRQVRASDEPPKGPEVKPRDRQVVEYVLEQIGRGAIQPGQRISEKSLATALGTSTGPVREALLSLAPLGLMRKQSRRQWEAAALNARQWEDLMELRRLVEMHCLEKLLARGLTTLERRFVEDQLRSTTRLAGAETINGAAFFPLDQALHQWLLQSCANPYVIDRHRFIYVIIEFQLRNGGFTVDRARLGAKQHIELLEHLLAGDAKSSRRVLRQHLESALVTLKALGASDSEASS